MALGCALIGALQLCSGSLKDLSFVHLPRHGRVSRDLPGNHKLHPRRLKKLYESGVLGHNSSLVHIEQQEIHPECGAATADAPQASWAGLQDDFLQPREGPALGGILVTHNLSTVAQPPQAPSPTKPTTPRDDPEHPLQVIAENDER